MLSFDFKEQGKFMKLQSSLSLMLFFQVFSVNYYVFLQAFRFNLLF